MRASILTIFILFNAFNCLASAPHNIPKADGEIIIDGNIQENAWERALSISRFYEIDPGENIEPPVGTVAYLTYDQENFYMAFRCFDPDPGQIRVRYADHDQLDQDDYVGIILDTFNDQRYGVEFFINPLGIQADLTRRDPGDEDESWDAIWDSAGRITAEGYEVEVAIPFKSLRFPNLDIQTWRFLLFRIYPRKFRHQIGSVQIDRNKNCILCQGETFTGMEGIKPGHNIEIVPSLTGIGTQSDFEEREFDSEGGISATWGITPNLTLNGTVNPDFSQVEADVIQIDVNTRFALFYPEKRPFFLEGQNFFETFMEAVYSRTIADPEWGVKFTGKQDKDAYAVLFAQDDQANFLIPSNQQSSLFTWEREVQSGIFRYRRDVGRDSTLGFLFTGRQADPYRSYLYGADGHVRLAENDFLNIQILRSDTTYPLLPDVSDYFDGSSIGGNAYYLSYEHGAEHWDYEAWYLNKDPEFRADLGFIPRVDVKNFGGSVAYEIYGNENPFFSRIHPWVFASRTENHAGESTDSEASAGVYYELAKQTTGEFGFVRDKELFNGVDYQKKTFYIWTNSRFSKMMTAWGRIEKGDRVDYINQRLGDATNYGLQFDLRLGRHIFTDFRANREILDVNEGRVYQASVYYFKGLYHFNEKLFFRAMLQLQDIKRNLDVYTVDVDAFDLREREKFFVTQLLFTYKINPFTLLYLGYSDSGLEQDNLDRITLNRTYFLKLSYAFRP